MCAGPGISRNVRCASPVSLQDIYPSLIDLSGVAPKNDIDGRSFRAYLEDPGKQSSAIPVITANEQGFSLRSERYRYIRYNKGTEELYDHQNDPMEWNNLAGDPQHAEVEAGLRAHIPVNPAGWILAPLNQTTLFHHRERTDPQTCSTHGDQLHFDLRLD
jgi:arylsulfatase A-like enzyme